MRKKQIEVGSKVWVSNDTYPCVVEAIGETQYVVSRALYSDGKLYYWAKEKCEVFPTKAARYKSAHRNDPKIGDYVMCVDRCECHKGLVVKANSTNLYIILDEEPVEAYRFRKDKNGLVRFPKSGAVVLVKATKK